MNESVDLRISEYEQLYLLEDTYWWYVGLREFVLSFLSHTGQKILDAGCGTGATAVALQRFGTTYQLDASPEALRFCKKRNLKLLTVGSVCQLPFPNECFDCIFSLDVLYHTGVTDDEQALREFSRVLKSGGMLILHLPAYEFLRSSHDEAIHTRRRYTRSGIQQKLMAAGFRIQKITYRNTVLFPLLLTYRLVRKALPDNSSDLKPLPDAANRIFLSILRIENAILRKVSLPFGSSVLCVATKPGSNAVSSTQVSTREE